MKHITKSDYLALQYHIEFGDIMDDDYHKEVVGHLTKCEMCKNRFLENENGIVTDKKEILEYEIIYIAEQIITENVQMDNDLTELQARESILEHFGGYHNFVQMFELYESYGGDLLDFLNARLDKIRNNLN